MARLFGTRQWDVTGVSREKAEVFHARLDHYSSGLVIWAELDNDNQIEASIDAALSFWLTVPDFVIVDMFDTGIVEIT